MPRVVFSEVCLEQGGASATTATTATAAQMSLKLQRQWHEWHWLLRRLAGMVAAPAKKPAHVNQGPHTACSQ